MVELKKEEMSIIKGGRISGAILTSLIRGISGLYELGRSLGSSIRRMFTRSYC